MSRSPLAKYWRCCRRFRVSARLYSTSSFRGAKRRGIPLRLAQKKERFLVASLLGMTGCCDRKLSRPPIRNRQLRNGFAIFARVGSSIVHACRVITHHGLSTAECIRKAIVHRQFVSLGLKLLARVSRDSIFELHVAPVERQLRETRRFERSLNVLVEVNHV